MVFGEAFTFLHLDSASLNYVGIFNNAYSGRQLCSTRLLEQLFLKDRQPQE